MIADLALQHLYDRVRLVRGKGDRRSGTLCIMSFVALLAGERHTDAPSTASPLVRQFAIFLNDAMPDAERQLLKPFAPRIIGTADDFDPGRAAVLRRAMQREVFPRICSDLQEGALPSGPLHDPCGVATAQPAKDLLCGFAALATAEDTSRNRRQLALCAARLLSTCAAAATTSTSRAWYWAQAINLLDQLCDVGMPRMRRGVNPARIEALLAADSLSLGSMGRAAAALRWVGRALAAGIGAAATAVEALAPPMPPPTAADAARDEIDLPIVPGA
jgi:hypothetical protein